MIRLEPIAAEHAPALQPLLEDPAIAESTPFPHPFPPGGALEWIAEALILQADGVKYAFAVRNGDGPPMGVSLLKDVNVEAREAELGYWIGRPYWGAGLATAAAAATLDFAFDALGLTTIKAVSLESNIASVRVLEKLGFVETGRLGWAQPKWPEPRPSIEFGLTVATW